MATIARIRKAAMKWPMVSVGKHYGIREGKARELARSGAAWFDCAVSSLREAA